MQTFTTKGATDLLYTDDYRSNGCPDVWCLLNESGAIEPGVTTGEVDSALEELELETSDSVGASRTADGSPGGGEPCGRKRVQIDSDVILDEVMTSLIERLNSARVLDMPV